MCICVCVCVNTDSVGCFIEWNIIQWTNRRNIFFTLHTDQGPVSCLSPQTKTLFSRQWPCDPPQWRPSAEAEEEKKCVCFSLLCFQRLRFPALWSYRSCTSCPPHHSSTPPLIVPVDWWVSDSWWESLTRSWWSVTCCSDCLWRYFLYGVVACHMTWWYFITLVFCVQVLPGVGGKTPTEHCDRGHQWHCQSTRRVQLWPLYHLLFQRGLSAEDAAAAAVSLSSSSPLWSRWI